MDAAEGEIMYHLTPCSRLGIACAIVVGLGGSLSPVEAGCTTGPPSCKAAPLVVSTVLGISGTVDANPNPIVSVVLMPGSNNVSLTASVPPTASSATFRAVQTNPAANGEAIVLATDTQGGTCTVPVSFRVRVAGVPVNEEICPLAEGYSFKVITAPSSPAGTTACSSHPATCPDSPPSGYEFLNDSHFLTVRSPIAGAGTQMELTRAGTFDNRLRLLFARSTDGGVNFSPLSDVTTSTTSGSTIIRGTGTWSDVKVVAAFRTGDNTIPTLGEWGMIIMSLLLLTVSSVLLASRRPALAAAGHSEHTEGVPLFVPGIFVRVLAGTAALGLVALTAVVLLGRAPDPTDVVGSLISGGILAYLVHLWAAMAKASSREEAEGANGKGRPR